MAHGQTTEELREALSLYALELLEAGEADWIAKHLEQGCAVCEMELREIRESLATFAAASPVDPPSGLRQRVLDRATQERTSQVWKEWAQPPAGWLHVVREGEGQWEAVAPGVTARRLYVDPTRDSVTMMVRMTAGSSYAPHRHAGPEQCFVLEGDLFDGEHRFYAGDFQCAAAGSTHGVQSTTNGCLLLIVSSMHDQLIA